MINIYKKVEKTLENPSGIIEIKNIDELNKPLLLCIAAQDDIDKSVYGIIREGAHAARVNTTQEMAAGFKIDELPVDFLGIRIKKEELKDKKEIYQDIVDKFIFPFLIKDNTKKLEKIIKQARRINLMTYCDGILTYEKIEKRLEEKFSDYGLSKEDIDSILSQISLVAIGTMRDTSSFKATTATFVDINDSEISNLKTARYQKILRDKNKKSFYGTLKNPNNILYIYEGTGNHQLKEYLKDGRIVKPAICGVLSKFLENSIENEKTDNLIKISSNDSLAQLKNYADETKNSADLLKELDSKLSYDGSPKYTLSESKMRHELDISYKQLQKKERKIKLLTERESYLEQINNSLLINIKNYLDETTYYQILQSVGLWQSQFEDEINNKHTK